MVDIILYICSTKFKKMKKTGILFVAAAALTVASCSSADEAKNEEVVAVTYTLDKENSKLSWTGSATDHDQAGTVRFSQGTVTMEGESLTGGSFTVDMNTISTTSLEGEKAASLDRHLKGLDDNEHHKPEDFFNINKFGNVEVSLGEYKDGKLTTTLNMLGQSLTQDVAVKISSDDKGASITGSFSLDFKSLNIPGFAVNEDGSGISPSVAFELNLALTK